MDTPAFGNTTLGNNTGVHNIPEYSIPVYLFYVGALVLTVLVVLLASFVVLCHSLYKRIQKKPPPQTMRMISNNDFNLRISDVLGVNKRRHLAGPNRLRKPSYFKQESFEANRFDRTYVIPNKAQSVNNTESCLSETSKILDNTNNENESTINNMTNTNASYDRSTRHLNIQMDNSKQQIEYADENKHCTGYGNDVTENTATGTDNNCSEYQIPKISVTAELKDCCRNQYQVPQSHYQTPTSARKFSCISQYQTPRKTITS